LLVTHCHDRAMPVPISGDGFSRRYSVVADTPRRWSEEEKQAIVAEAAQPCANVSAVARRHGIKPSLLFRWMARDEGNAKAAGPAFLPVALAAPPANGDAAGPAGNAESPADSRIEIELENGRRVRVGAGADTGLLSRILDLLDRR
jgi:transposase